MFQEKSTTGESSVGKLERFACRLESLLTQKPWLSPFLLSAVFLPCALMKARRSMFWYDELLTFYLAASPNFSTLWRALMAHAESGSPVFHVVTKLSGDIFGWTTFGLRVPAMVGYLTMMQCVYFIVRRYAGPLYAAIGALSGFLTLAPFYSVEARPYGLLLGLSSIALVCWQQASKHFRWLAILGLFLSLGVAVSLQYYAVLSVASIGLGELVHAWRSRRIDWPVWGALVFAATPLFLFLPLIRANTILAHGGYAPATLSFSANNTASFYLPFNGALWAAFVLVAGICILVFGRREAEPPATFEVPPVHELAAWAVLLLALVEVFIAGRLVTGVFHSRYGIVTIIGFSILLPLCLRRLFRGSRAAALAELLVLILYLGGGYMKPKGPQRSIERLNANLTPWARTSKMSALPIVVDDPGMYLLMAHSAAKEVRDVIVYTPDGHEASWYRRPSTADYNLGGLRGVTPLNMPNFTDFTSSHERFLVLWDNSPTDWFVPKLLSMGAELRVCAVFDTNLLLLVDLPETKAPAGDGSTRLPVDQVCVQNE